MAGSGCVEDDEIGGPGRFEALDPAEHQKIADAGGGGGDDLYGATGRQTSGQTGQTVIGQILGQRLVRGHETASDVALARSGPGMKGLFDAGEVGLGEQSADGAAGGQAYQKGGKSAPGGRAGQGCGHGAFAHASLPGHDEDP